MRPPVRPWPRRPCRGWVRTAGSVGPDPGPRTTRRPAAGGSPLRKTPDRHRVGASVRGEARRAGGTGLAAGPPPPRRGKLSAGCVGSSSRSRRGCRRCCASPCACCGCGAIGGSDRVRWAVLVEPIPAAEPFVESEAWFPPLVTQRVTAFRTLPGYFEVSSIVSRGTARWPPLRLPPMAGVHGRGRHARPGDRQRSCSYTSRLCLVRGLTERPLVVSALCPCMGSGRLIGCPARVGHEALLRHRRRQRLTRLRPLPRLRLRPPRPRRTAAPNRQAGGGHGEGVTEGMRSFGGLPLSGVSGSHTMPADRPGGRGLADRAGGGRDGRLGRAFSWPTLHRPGGGGRLSPPEDTGPPSGRCFCARGFPRAATGGSGGP